MICAFTSYKQNNWEHHLPSAEFTFNNTVNISTRLTPFYINYGQNLTTPSNRITHLPDQVPATSEMLESIHNATKMAQDSLAIAKANQEIQANKKRRSLTFQVGEKVLLSSTHINLASRNPKATRKLSPRFIRP